MKTIRTLAEPLTIAYIAMGAQTYMQTAEFRHRETQTEGGELEFVGDIISHARMLDSKADERQDDFSGVFLYEVAEEFGNKLAQRLALMGEASPAFIEGLADALIDTCCR